MSFESHVVHAAGVALFGYSLYYHLVWVWAPPELLAKDKNLQAANLWPGKWRYLTIWNAVLQLTYHLIALLNDLMGSATLNKKRQSFLQKLRDGYFASIIFPTGMHVSITFWTLYTLDRKLIFPVEYDVFYPSWLNHCLHTGPILFLAGDCYFVPKIYPLKAIGIIANLFFSGIYSAWIFVIYHVTNVWVYPVFTVLGPMQRSIFIATCNLAILMFYFLGEAINNWRWAPEMQFADQRKKKSK